MAAWGVTSQYARTMKGFLWSCAIFPQTPLNLLTLLQGFPSVIAVASATIRPESSSTVHLTLQPFHILIPASAKKGSGMKCIAAAVLSLLLVAAFTLPFYAPSVEAQSSGCMDSALALAEGQISD